MSARFEFLGAPLLERPSSGRTVRQGVAALLCNFAHAFPERIAKLLDRSVGLRRRFREETATELLLMGLSALQGHGVHVDFSEDEAVDGADMEWIFVAPRDIGGGSYLRLLIQAKVARERQKVKAPYWYYEHLDHKGGRQARDLLDQASAAGGGVLPLYLMFHPGGALRPTAPGLPAVTGVNLLFASDVQPVVGTGCGLAKKKVEFWRDRFLSLSDILCWPMLSKAPPPPDAAMFEFLFEGMLEHAAALSVAWHPDLVAARLNTLRGQTRAVRSLQGRQPPIEAARQIPSAIRRALAGEETAQDRRDRRGARVIFTTPLRNGDPDFVAWTQHVQRG